MSKHLLVAVSAHGFGHIAQISPIINALKQCLPTCAITIMSDAPKALLQARLLTDFEYWSVCVDQGMKMVDALTVDVDASILAYETFHHQWQADVDDLSVQLAQRKIDLILADVPYLVLEAAAILRIPSIALCSLNWADVYADFAPINAQTTLILQQIQQAYAKAQVFLQPEPSMPMLKLSNTQMIGPVATIGCNQNAVLKQQLGVAPHTKIVLISLGGIDTPLSIHEWPQNDDIFWLFAKPSILNQINLSFMDILCSVDVLLTKPGYGSFAEAVCNGLPVIFTRRDQWPEELALVNWLMAHNLGYEISRQQLKTGDFQEALTWALTKNRQPIIDPHGVTDTVDILYQQLTPSV